MSSMIERLSEIEETAEAIVEHAEEEKHEIEKKIQAKRDAFDRDLEIEARDKVEQILEEQRQKNAATIEAMKRDFEEHHNVYAREILKHMVEV